MVQIFTIKNCTSKAFLIKPACLQVVNTIILFTFITLSAISQNYNFEVRTIPLEGELANFSGACFLQDRDGFMWFGSTEGLYRYHGNGFKVFHHEPNVENSLSNNSILDIYEDSEGIIWIGTENGLNLYDKHTEKFKRYVHDEKDSSSINDSFVSDITQDKYHNLWVATRYGFSMYEKETGTFKNYQIFYEGSFTGNNPIEIYELHFDNENKLFLNTINGIYKFDIANGAIEQIKYIGNKQVDWIFISRSGRLWFFGDNALYRNKLHQSFTELAIKPVNSNTPQIQYIYSIIEDSNGNTWIRATNGIYCFNKNMNLIYTLVFTEIRNQINATTRSKNILTDKTGNLWYFTTNAINQIIHHGNHFRVYKSKIAINNCINCIYLENENLIWYGTLQGINCYDRNRNDFLFQYLDTLQNPRLPFQVLTFHPDNRGSLWAGMRYRGLFSLVESENNVRRLRIHGAENVDSTNLSKSGLYGIKYIFEDTDGRLWIGSQGYRFLHYYDTLQNKVFRLVDSPTTTNKLPERGVIRHQTGTDTLWVIGTSGIYTIKLPLTQVSNNEVMANDVVRYGIYDEHGQMSSLPFVQKSFMGKDGTIWLGTSKNGLIKAIKKKEGTKDANEFFIKSYSINDGLPSIRVVNILPDTRGNLWLGTKNGLSRFNSKNETFTNFFVRHGLPNNQFNPGSAAVGKNGEMFFGTVDGMISFYPDSVTTDQYSAPVMLTGLKVNNRYLQPGIDKGFPTSISYTNHIELPYNKNNISLEYASLNYSYPEYNQYRYKLKGFNDEWIQAGNRSYVDYTNLDPGKYTFVVSGSNNDGIWNEKGKSLDIIIHRPPWLTWYAYAFYILALAGILLWYQRYLKNKARLQLAIQMEKVEKEKLVEMDQIKSRFFANISHEFRTPLTLIRGPVDDLIKKKSDKTYIKKDVLNIIQRSTVRLQNLINQLLDISKMETGKVKLQVTEGSIEVCIRTIIQSFLSMAGNRNIDYKYQLPETNMSVWFDGDKVEKILINLISNALKFTPKDGQISIKCRYNFNENTDEPESLTISVSDTGIGIPADKIDRIFDRFYQVNNSDKRIAEGTGIGLSLTKELIEIYRGEIKLESKEGAGTSFWVKLPVAKDKFKDDELILNRAPKEPELNDLIINETLNDTEEEKLPAVNGKMKQDQTLILIVEDNPDLTKYICQKLTNGYRILSAENGKEGFEMAIKHIPDLVISDLMMPVMDGLEMCRMIKEEEKTSHIPIIMLTAKADRDSKLEGLHTGADDYIVKPFDTEELQVRVKNLIDQRNKLREKYRMEILHQENTVTTPEIKDPLLKKMFGLIDQHYSDSDFDVNEMAKEMNMSRAQFYRKISALLGETPNELLKIYRIKKAASLLKSGTDNIAGIMYEVGFKNPSYFAASFRKVYGLNPSDYRETIS